MKQIAIGLHDDGPEADKRLIAATIDGLRVLSAYVPNGKSTTLPAFRDKLRWLARLRETLERGPGSDIVLCGDFNIAADDRDVYDPEAMRGQLHFHPDEHKALAQLLDMGLVDAFRLHHEEGGLYSWWDYRGGGFRKNQGLRIDYVFLARGLAGRCTAATMDVEERRRDKPSDHIPVVIEVAPPDGRCTKPGIIR